MPESPELRKWRSLLRRRPLKGQRTRNFSNWIRRLYRTKGFGAPFHVEDMMVACNEDPESRRDYAAAQRFLQKQRKDFAIAMLAFFNSPEFEKYYNDGLSEEQLFRKLVETAVSWNRFPVWSDKDDDRNYHLYNMASYIHLKERRALALRTEIHRGSAELGFAFEKFPSLPGSYNKPRLETDGKFLGLPPAIECEVCHQHFAGQKQLLKHYQEDHPEFFIDFRDRGPPTGLDALFGDGNS